MIDIFRSLSWPAMGRILTDHLSLFSDICHENYPTSALCSPMLPELDLISSLPGRSCLLVLSNELQDNLYSIEHLCTKVLESKSCHASLTEAAKALAIVVLWNCCFSTQLCRLTSRGQGQVHWLPVIMLLEILFQHCNHLAATLYTHQLPLLFHVLLHDPSPGRLTHLGVWRTFVGKELLGACSLSCSLCLLL